MLFIDNCDASSGMESDEFCLREKNNFFQNCLREKSNGIAESTPCKGVPRSRCTRFRAGEILDLAKPTSSPPPRGEKFAERIFGGARFFACTTAKNKSDGRSVARVFVCTTFASHRPEPKIGKDGATIYVSSIEEIPSNRKTSSIRKTPSNRKKEQLLPISKRRYGCSPFFRAGVAF